MAKSKILIKPKQRGVIPGIDVAAKRLAVAQTHLSLYSMSGKLEEVVQRDVSEGTILRARWAPGGRSIAFADTKLRAMVHDFDEGETRVLDLRDDNVQWVDYARERNRLVVAGVSTRVWDGDRQEVIWSVPGGKKKRKEPAVGCLSADGETIAIGGAESGLIVLYAISTGKKIAELEGAPDLVRCIDMDPQGTRLACCEANAKATRLWDLKSGRQIEPEDFADKDGVLALRFSPDGRYLALGWIAGGVDVYTAADGLRVQYDMDHKKRVWDLAFTADGKSLLSAGDDGVVRIRGLP